VQTILVSQPDAAGFIPAYQTYKSGFGSRDHSELPRWSQDRISPPQTGYEIPKLEYNNERSQKKSQENS